MPRDLGDVLHYFIPESGDPERPRPERLTRDEAPRAHALSLPIGDHDVVRSALAWNLAVELTSQGMRSCVIAPGQDPESPLWPVSSEGPLSVEVDLVDASSLETLASRVRERLAAPRSVRLAISRVPPRWLLGARDSRDPESLRLLDWVLLFTTPDRNDLIESYGLIKLIRRIHPRARIAVALHGTADAGEAERALDRLEAACVRHLGAGIETRGVLRDDLHLYRAIVSERPVGLAHPQSPVAKALREFAAAIRQAAERATRG